MRLARWLGFALVVAGLVRAAAVVGHAPLLGYANQYDMHRTGACVGLYPDLPPSQRYAPTPGAPIAEYRWEATQAGCYGSTEVALLAAVAVAARASGADRMRIQWVGYAKLALLAFAALSLAWSLREFPRASVVHGAIVALVLGDPAVTLWFNTLYTEFFVIWGLYASIGAICAIALGPRQPHVAWLLALAGLCALAFSKEQFALLPAAIAASSVPWLWRRSHSGTAVLVVAAVVCAALSEVAVPRPDDIRKTNRAHAYLGLVVPAARDPVSALTQLSLPPSCLSVAGSPWMLRQGATLQRECARVFDLDATAFLRLLPSQPDALLRSVALVMPGLQQAVIPYLGISEAGGVATPASASLLGFLGSRMNGGLFVVLCIAAMLSPFAALAQACRTARPSRERPRVELLFVMLVGGVVFYAMLTTVFGDGLTEAGRHFWPGFMALDALVVAAIVGAFFARGSWTRERVAIGVAAAIVAAAMGGAFAWTRTQPLAIGLLDEPASCSINGATLAIRGWALSPHGVAAIEATVGDRRFIVHHGLDTARLARIFPGYPDSAHGGFALDVAGADLPALGSGESIPLRVLVTDRLGNTNMIDHCPLHR